MECNGIRPIYLKYIYYVFYRVRVYTVTLPIFLTLKPLYTVNGIHTVYRTYPLQKWYVDISEWRRNECEGILSEKREDCNVLARESFHKSDIGIVEPSHTQSVKEAHCLGFVHYFYLILCMKWYWLQWGRWVFGPIHIGHTKFFFREIGPCYPFIFFFKFQTITDKINETPPTPPCQCWQINLCTVENIWRLLMLYFTTLVGGRGGNVWMVEGCLIAFCPRLSLPKS